jgi:hypothetical protein
MRDDGARESEYECDCVTLEECENAYVDTSKGIFTSTSRAWADPRRLYAKRGGDAKLDERSLVEAILKVLEKKNIARVELLKDTRSDDCKVFVCATREIDRCHGGTSPWYYVIYPYPFAGEFWKFRHPNCFRLSLSLDH